MQRKAANERGLLATNGIHVREGVLRVKYLFLLGCSFVAAAPALADESAGGDAAGGARNIGITVVASGQSEPVDATGQSVSVVGAEEIASVQGPDVTRVLQRLPGVVFSRNGGMGGFTGVRVRGAASEQVLVLIDGVRVADVSSPSGGYDFGNLMSGNIEKVELLRGSNSTVWGSEAIGGVLAVTTREVDGVEGSAEYGARDSLYATAAAGISRETHAATLTAGYARDDGFSALSSGTEPDGYRQWQLSGKGRVAVAPGLTLRAAARYADSKLDLDFFGDSLDVQTARQFSGQAGLDYTGDALDLSAGFSLADTHRVYDNPVWGSYDYKGRDERAELKGRWHMRESLALVFGAEHEWSRYSGTFDPRQKANATSGHALLQYNREGVNLAAGVRIDDHSGFGSEWTFGSNGSVALVDGWRLRASYGEGFKAPTLYQLYGFAGNTALAPERSRSYEAGIEKGDRNAGLHIAATVFRRDAKNLIDYLDCFGSSDPLCAGGAFGVYINIGKARAEGFELELGTAVTERFRAQASYSYVKTENRTPGDANAGNDLARRPRHAVTIAADWRTPLHDLTLGSDLRLVGDSYDDAANATRLDSYVLVALRASLPVTETVELFGRVENVGDTHYQTAAGYNTPGRSAYFGARARF